MLWIPVTLVAAVAQTARNAAQSSLTGAVGTLGATQVRFVYGFPFALAFLAFAVAVMGEAAPAPTPRFAAFVAGGAVAQILATALLLAAMRLRAFSVVTAFTKTEALQVALFGFVVLGEPLTAARVAAVVAASAGVLLVATKAGARPTSRDARAVLFGIASGGLFALAAVGFRGAILALPAGSFWLRATTALVWSLGFQTLLLGAWMTLFARAALERTFALWRQSLLAGFMGAFASQFWFLALSLTAAANVRTLALIEVLFAQLVARNVFAQRVTAPEAAGMALIVAGVVLLLVA